MQTHALASFIAVPLLGLHLGSHLFESLRAVRLKREKLVREPSSGAAVYTRRAFVGGVALSAAGLAYATQNGPLSRRQVGPFFIGRGPKNAPPGQRFPIETLFGVTPVPADTYRLELAGTVERPAFFTLADLARLPVQTRTIRTSCVSGWTSVTVWSGCLVRDVLALAGLRDGVKPLSFRSATDYNVPWPAYRALGDDALLATMVNGEDLSVEHGAPLRLIAPGYPSENMVKEVVRIRAGTEPNEFSPDLAPVAEARCGPERRA